MLILVLADSYAGLFVGWEGVGLASYLLIGFWNHVPANAVAAKKAFVMNRVGDMGLLIAMMAMVANFSTVNMEKVNSMVVSISPVQATIIGFFLLVGACGKSAQFPLQASSTRQRWSPPVSTSSFALVQSSRLRPLLRPRSSSSARSRCSSARSSAARRTI